MLTYDKKRLYIGFDSEFPEGEKLVGVGGQRDTGRLWREDSVELFLAPNAAVSQDYFQLILNHAGSMYDLRAGKKTWNGNWDVGTHVSPGRWTGEIAIAFSELNTATPKHGTEWRMNFCRDRAAGGSALESWSDIGTRYINPPRFGRLIFGGRTPTVRVSSGLPISRTQSDTSSYRSRNWVPG